MSLHIGNAALIAFGVWGILLLLMVTQASLRNPAFSWWSTFLSWSPDFLVRALLTAPVLYLVQRVPIAASRPLRAFFTHLGASLLWSPLYVALHAALILLLWPRTGRHADAASFFLYLFSGEFAQGLLSYWAICAVGHAWLFSRRIQAAQLDAAKTESALRQAQLTALQRQISPHFFFNALHTISTLVGCGRREEAQSLLTSLGELLRSRLSENTDHEVALSTELEILDCYLAIERARFGDRISINIAVEEGLETALVPSLFLQPLVENAIQHGVSKRESGGLVELQISARNDVLSVEVIDNGLASLSIPSQGGIGLANLRARLSQLFPNSYRLEAAARGEGGFRVSVEFPLRGSRRTVDALHL